MPYFSIIIPSFNRAHIINRAIQVVLDQTFQDFEILIIDDADINTVFARLLIVDTYNVLAVITFPTRLSVDSPPVVAVMVVIV